jgi:hypothetical protein
MRFLTVAGFTYAWLAGGDQSSQTSSHSSSQSTARTGTVAVSVGANASIGPGSGPQRRQPRQRFPSIRAHCYAWDQLDPAHDAPSSAPLDAGAVDAGTTDTPHRTDAAHSPMANRRRTHFSFCAPSGVASPVDSRVGDMGPSARPGKGRPDGRLISCTAERSP